jgi:hypothetical protein
MPFTRIVLAVALIAFPLTAHALDGQSVRAVRDRLDIIMDKGEQIETSYLNQTSRACERNAECQDMDKRAFADTQVSSFLSGDFMITFENDCVDICLQAIPDTEPVQGQRFCTCVCGDVTNMRTSEDLREEMTDEVYKNRAGMPVFRRGIHDAIDECK